MSRRRARPDAGPLGDTLPSYRLYRLDGAGKIITADWIEADDADDALRKAKAAPPHGTVELWERGRLLGRFRGGKPV